MIISFYEKGVVILPIYLIIWLVHLFAISVFLTFAGTRYNPKLFSWRDMFWLLNGATLVYFPMKYFLQQLEMLIP